MRENIIGRLYGEEAVAVAVKSFSFPFHPPFYEGKFFVDESLIMVAGIMLVLTWCPVFQTWIRLIK